MIDTLTGPRDVGSLRRTGMMIALMGALLMSFDPVFIRLSGVGGFDTVFLFGLFTAISMPVFLQLRDPRGAVGAIKASGWPIVISGLLMLGSATCLVLSIKLTSVANTFVILSTAPALAAVFSRVFLGEVTSRATWIAITFIMIGVAIVVSGSLGSGNLTGDALAFAAVTFVSLNQVYLRKFQQVSRMASVGMGGVFLALVMIIPATPSSFNLETWLIMAAIGLFTAPIGRVLSQVATRYITAPEVGLILMMEAVFAPALAFVFFTEVPAIPSFIGGAVILLTVLLYSVRDLKL